MSLNIGTLVGYLQLDDTQFTRKADAADKKINGLKLHLEALGKSNPKISVEVDVQTKQLEALQARIADLKAQSARGINVNVEMVQALVDLDRIQVKLREMHNAEIKVHVDDAEALTKLAALKKATDSISGANLGSVGGMFGNIAAFGPALLPMVNMLPGALFAVGSGAVASAAGVGVLALAFHGLGASVQAYQKYQDALPFAKNAAQVAALKKTLDLSAYGDMNASGRDFTRTIATRGAAAGTGIKQAAQAGVFPGADRALHDILPLVPTIEHLMRSLGTTVGDMTDQAAKALNSPFWRQWFHWLGEDAKTQLPLVGGIFGHFFTGLMQGIERFSPQGTSLLTWLDDMMKRFENWTGSPQFDHFMATTAADATLVGHALEPLGPILGNLYKGLSASGNAELLVLGDVLQGISHLPAGAIEIIGMALPGIFLALKGAGLASTAATGVMKLGGAFTFLRGEMSTTQTAIAGIAGAAGIGLILSGMSQADDSTKTLETTLGGLAAGFAIGGPVGAAVGALGGFVASLVTSGDETHTQVRQLGEYGDALDSVTGKLRKNALARVIATARQASPNLFTAAGALGISDAQVGKAIMGNKRVQASIAETLRLAAKASTTAMIPITLPDGTKGEIDAMNVLQQALYGTRIETGKGSKAVDGLTQTFATQAAAIRANAAQVQAMRTALAGLPPNIKTKITNQSSGDLTLHDIRELADRYKKTPPEIRTLLHMDGLDVTNAGLKRLLEQAQNVKNLHAKPTIDSSSIDAGITRVKTLATLLQNIVGPALAHLPSAPKPPKLPPGMTAGAHAAGGTVEGQRMPYGDKTMIFAAPGEEVTPNDRGQADKNRGALKAAARGATLVAMAGGGTIPGDPLTGFGPNSIPASGSGSHHHHHKKASTSSASHAASKAAAARRKALQARLTLINAQLAATKSELAAAQNWSQTFAGNAFSADLTPFEKPGPVTTSIVNGMKVTQSGAVDTSPAGILTAMLAYQKSQETQAGNLAAWVKKLRGEGVSNAVLAQMQAAGPQGIAEIQALASGSKAQVQQFNAMNVATTASLNQTGALATSGQNFTALQRQQMNEQSTIKAIKKALAGPVPVKVVSGNLRP